MTADTGQTRDDGVPADSGCRGGAPSQLPLLGLLGVLGFLSRRRLLVATSEPRC